MKLLDKLKSGLLKFSYGRHGMDQLGMAMLILIFLISFISSFFQNETVRLAFSFLQLAVSILFIVRVLSKNNAKRYAENAKFLKFWWKVKSSVTGFFSRVKDKDHRYFRCECGTYLRVPKGKGKIKITCSNCGKQMIKKS